MIKRFIERRTLEYIDRIVYAAYHAMSRVRWNMRNKNSDKKVISLFHVLLTTDECVVCERKIEESEREQCVYLLNGTKEASICICGECMRNVPEYMVANIHCSRYIY